MVYTYNEYFEILVKMFEKKLFFALKLFQPDRLYTSRQHIQFSNLNIIHMSISIKSDVLLYLYPSDI